MKGSSSDLECLPGKPREPSGRRSPAAGSNLRGNIRLHHNREEQPGEQAQTRQEAREDVVVREQFHLISLLMRGIVPADFGREAPTAGTHAGEQSYDSRGSTNG